MKRRDRVFLKLDLFAFDLKRVSTDSAAAAASPKSSEQPLKTLLRTRGNVTGGRVQMLRSAAKVAEAPGNPHGRDQPAFDLLPEVPEKVQRRASAGASVASQDL